MYASKAGREGWMFWKKTRDIGGRKCELVKGGLQSMNETMNNFITIDFKLNYYV